jgi:RNA polymerase sigma-70 factor (ECF subfamily)
LAIGEQFPMTLAAAQQGDRAALEAIYRDLAPGVLGYLRGRGCPDPDDVAAESFVQLVRWLERFSGDEAAFRSFVFTIVHRRMLDSLRRARRRLDDPVADFDTTPVRHLASAAEDEAIDVLAHDRALRLLDGLTDDQRSVVLLRILGDLPVAEVARVMGKEPGAVKTLQRRALASLARTLVPEGLA